MEAGDRRYLQVLARSYPTIVDASAEIINLNAILNLPKSTEMFVSDIHGEYVAFSHLLHNGGGAIRSKVDDTFGERLSEEDKRTLSTLIFYPREKMKIELEKSEDPDRWCQRTLLDLAAVCRHVSAKYTRSHLRKMLPSEFSYIIEELMTEGKSSIVKKRYFLSVVRAVVKTGQAAALIEAMCSVIKKLVIDHLHVVGDIYDRGPEPDKIINLLADFHSLDIQWGNHDVVWMGAALGQRGCIAHVVRNCARYGNLDVLGDAYGINLVPLVLFALRVYKDDPCEAFALKVDEGLMDDERVLNMKIQKAMAVLQFKVEAATIDANPSYGLENRKLLHKMDLANKTIEIDGVKYELTDTEFPTVDWSDPYRLSDAEEELMHSLEKSFMESEKLQNHMRFLLEYGSLYKITNGNLLIHAGVPLTQKGDLLEVDVYGKKLAGRALYQELEQQIRNAFDSPDEQARQRGRDILWWLWLAPGSPLFAKDKMATFEIYLCKEKEARHEQKNAFYTLLEDTEVLARIFKDFGMDPDTSRIICGHVPVKVKDGEDPVKCGGRVLRIDGGFSKAYRPQTGIAGITLVYGSQGISLSTHEPLESTQATVEEELDIVSHKRFIERADGRILVSDTDKGEYLRQRIRDLECLLEAYQTGEISKKKDVI